MGKDLNGKELGVGLSQRPDGRYMARFTDRRGRRHTVYDKDIRKLRRKLRDMKYESDHGTLGDGAALTLDEWFEEFMILYKVGRVKNTTEYKIRTIYKACIKPYIGRRRLADIKAIHVQVLINKLFEEGRAYGTVINVKSLISEMFRMAIGNEYVLRNPCAAVVMPKQPRLDTKFLTLEEQKRFMSASKGYLHYDIFAFALTTGMRIGEVLGLKWSDIDFDNKQISIKRTLHYSRLKDEERCHFFFTTPKTETSERTIPMIKTTEDILYDVKRKQAESKIINARIWKNPFPPFDDLVFTAQNGSPIRYGDVNRSIKNIVSKINSIEEGLAKEEGRDPVFMEGFSPHCFRHTYVTRCRENNIPLETIQSMVGHSNEEMTLHYAHDRKAVDLEKLSQIDFI